MQLSYRQNKLILTEDFNQGLLKFTELQQTSYIPTILSYGKQTLAKTLCLELP
jgi:hypothetical protein